jgi:hypothetical protein
VAETKHDKGSDGTPEGATEGATDGAAPPPGKQQPPVCTVAFCPICMAVTAGQAAAPDVVEHLLAAAREFFLAARAVIDVRGDHMSGADQNPNGSKDFQRIEIS